VVWWLEGNDKPGNKKNVSGVIEKGFESFPLKTFDNTKNLKKEET
jgi:hypothetical protein